MKKIIAVLLVFLMMFATCACEREGTKLPSDSDKTTEPTQTSSSPEEASDSEPTELPQKESYLVGTYKVPMYDICVDVPDYKEIEKGYTELFIVFDTKYVAMTAMRRTEVGSLQEAHDSALAEFSHNVQNYSRVNEIIIETDSTETINGTEVYKYEGILNYGTNPICEVFITGYSFIYDGIPCNISGVVLDETQSEELIEEIRTVVEEMMLSVRAER